MPDGQVASALEVMTGTTDAGAPIATDILVLPIYDAVRIRTGEHLVWPRPDRAATRERPAPCLAARRLTAHVRAPTSACTACVNPSTLRWNIGKRRPTIRVVCV